MEAGQSGRKPGSGYVTFAAVLFLVLGLFNSIDGIAALAEDQNFVENDLFFGNLAMWGAIVLTIGVLQLIASARLFAGKGRSIAIFLLVINLVAQLFFLPAYPIWSVIVMAIDFVLLYGLTVYGEHFED